MLLTRVDIPTNPDWQPPDGKFVRPSDLDHKYYKKLGAWRKLGYDLGPGETVKTWAKSWSDTTYNAYFHIDQMQKIDQSHRFQTGQVMTESVE